MFSGLQYHQQADSGLQYHQQAEANHHYDFFSSDLNHVLSLLSHCEAKIVTWMMKICRTSILVKSEEMLANSGKHLGEISASPCSKEVNCHKKNQNFGELLVPGCLRNPPPTSNCHQLVLSQEQLLYQIAQSACTALAIEFSSVIDPKKPMLVNLQDSEQSSLLTSGLIQIC